LIFLTGNENLSGGGQLESDPTGELGIKMNGERFVAEAVLVVPVKIIPW
jgi:hypothetical protein